MIIDYLYLNFQISRQTTLSAESPKAEPNPRPTKLIVKDYVIVVFNKSFWNYLP